MELITRLVSVDSGLPAIMYNDAFREKTTMGPTISGEVSILLGFVFVRK